MRYLGELERIAEQNYISRRGRHRESVGERNLSGLIDDKIVEGAIELIPRKEPGSAGDKLNAIPRLDNGCDLRFTLYEISLIHRVGIIGRLLQATEA